MIATTFWEIKFLAASTADVESTHVESNLDDEIVLPPNNNPEFEASLKASSDDFAIAGVKELIGPVKPRTIPTFISARRFEALTDINIIIDINNFIKFILIDL